MEGKQNKQHCRTAMLVVENILDEDQALLVTYDPDKTSALAIEEALENGLESAEYADTEFVEVVRDILSDLAEEVRSIKLIQV